LKRIERLAVVVVLIGIATAFPAAALADDGAEEAEETRVCPGCGEVIPASSVFCPNCGRYFPDAKIKVEGRRQAETEEKARVVEPARRLITVRAKGGMLTGSGMTNGGGWLFAGFRVAKKVALGAGFGYQSYPNGISYPISASVRASLTDGKIAPIVYGDIGYNKARFKVVYPGGPDPSGVFLGLGGGIDILNKRGVGFTLEAGGRFEDSVEYWGYYFPGTNVYKYFVRDKTFSFFHLAAGVVF
jgi:hypothetical protein